MKIINKSKITKILNFHLKLIVLSSLLFSQLSLSEIFLYQNDPDTSSINITKANTSDTWYNTSYLYRKEITINSTKVPNTDQTNFPVLISLTDTALRAVANGGKVTNASGYDIIFTNQAGDTKLDHEIESYDAVNGTIVMWVKIPVLSYQNNTVIYIYYGNTGISTTQENKTGVWDSNFKMVQHMNQDPSGAGAQMLDSTSIHNNGTSSGMVAGDLVDGKFGKALNFDSVDGFVDLSANVANLGLANGSLEMWFKSGNAIGLCLFGFGTSDSSAGNFMGDLTVGPRTSSYTDESMEFFFKTDYSSKINTFVRHGEQYYGDNVWHQVVVAAGSDFNKIYVDGVEQSLTYKEGSAAIGNYFLNITNLSAMAIGRRWQPATPIYYNGSIDEVRISNAVRSADWIATEYNNQFNPTPGAGNFILPLGTEEAYATSYDFTTPSPSSGLVGVTSQDFTIDPNGIYTGTITITLSGGGLSSTITKTFNNSSTPQTFTITPTIAGTVTLTLTNSGTLTNPSPATYSSISISASPTSITQGSIDNTIDITGINTSWTASTPGSPTFTLSGGTGASITNQTVTDPTHATITLNAGSTAGNLTITDPSTGATTTVSVVPNTANLTTSFNLNNPATTGTIDNINHTVSLTVPYNTTVTNLAPTITVSTGATISPLSDTPQDFTNPVIYTVTAQDGTPQTYIVTVTISPNANAGSSILSTKPIILLNNNQRVDTSTLPQDIIQIAISRTPDFKDTSWEVFNKDEFIKLDKTKETLYIKFRTKSGSTSDVFTYIPETGNNINTSNLQDGDIVKTISSPDVYIIKIKNNKQYKRLILSPSVFQSYQHLKWGNLKIISQEELDRYTTSNLVKETSDTIIYELFPNGDTGERRVFDVSKSYDADSVYEINQVDRDSYKLVG